MIENLYDKFIALIKNRLFAILLLTIVCFYILVQRLFELQIVNGEQYAANITNTISRTLDIPALRGNIYDRYGRPLAVNETAFSVKFNPSIAVVDLNTVIYDLLKTLEENNEQYIDEFPITKETPYEFTFSSTSAEKNWKENMGFKKEKLEYTATETIEYLRTFFGISPELSTTEARNMLSIRSEIFMQRFRQYNVITLATDVSKQVVALIEEQGERFPGVYIDVEPLRYYPEGDRLSHILGYIRPISGTEYDEYKDHGYTETDLVGKLGIEKTYELILNGQKGQEVVEVTNTGKVASRFETISPKKGANIYLTLDKDLQNKTAHILLENLKKVLIAKIDSGEITIKQLLISMVNSNNISINNIMKSSGGGTTQSVLRDVVLKAKPEFDMLNSEDVKEAKQIIMDSIDDSTITPSQFILCLVEQEKITCDEDTLIKLQRGTASSYAIIKEKIISDEISPSSVNLDPCTGSVAVVDVNSGDVLSLVTYPSYDNNMLVNNFNNEYYQKLLNDPTFPLINRPLAERKAPGSTLKMLSAIAGLESGTISPSTRIQDYGIYKTAGIPYANCLIYTRSGGTHGAINVAKAIEVSCNYFFYEVAYRMGNATEGSSLNSIGVLNEYMKKFGLNDYSGVEIEESRPKMDSPEAKEIAEKANNKDATVGQLRWKDGDSIRSAIGQSYNSYSVIHMAKYIATLANGGSRYKLNLVNGIKEVMEAEINKTVPTIEEQFDIAPENLEAVFQGMLGVTIGTQGTLRGVFAGFPVQVAGKTGTAEESDRRPSHTWFTGFAPYDDPQIAVVVMIPFGESKENPAPKIAKEIFAEYLGLYAEPEWPIEENSLIR